MLNKKSNKKYRLTLSQVVVIGFLAIILVGAGLLCLPFATKNDGGIAYVDALFTATSATCVTGLAVGATFETFTVFGQVVIVMLIQVGGLGFMTLSSAIYMLIGKKVGLRTMLDIQEDMDDIYGGMRGFKTLISRIILISFSCEFVGTVLLTAAFCKYYPFFKALGKGAFCAVSAFCNAGFDLTENGNSLIPFNDNPLVLVTVMLLVVMGGIGFLVVRDVFEKRRWSRFKLHTKVVIVTSAALILVGAALTAGFEWNGAAFEGMTAGQKILNSFFASVTARTAGFCSVKMENLSQPSLVLNMLLMFVGASPASTGGGIKTTTLFVLIWTAVATVRQKTEVVVAKREISKKTIMRAVSTIVIAFALVFVSTFLLILLEKGRFASELLLFEEISAFATVGLTVGITPLLCVGSKLVLIFSMFLGRVGMLTFFMSFSPPDYVDAKIKFKEAQISI